MGDYDYCKYWKHQDGGARNHPAESLRPARQLIVTVTQRCEVDEIKYEDRLKQKYIVNITIIQFEFFCKSDEFAQIFYHQSEKI